MSGQAVKTGSVLIYQTIAAFTTGSLSCKHSEAVILLTHHRHVGVMIRLWGWWKKSYNSQLTLSLSILGMKPSGITGEMIVIYIVGVGVIIM